MDEIEQAQRQEAMTRDAALAQHQAKRRRPEPLVIDGVCVCAGCFEPIDARRLLAVPDADRCTQCQDDLERFGWTGP